jgi:elongation factor Ts
MGIGSEAVKQLREMSNAGVMDCKRALAEAEGNLERALEILRQKGAIIAQSKCRRVAKEGCVGAYIHLGDKIGVLIEVNCESDFVARNEEFRRFVKDICMQIAALRPSYIKREDIPTDVLKKEKQQLDEFCRENCLLEQPFIKDESITVGDYLTSLIAKIGENILIKRFTRYEVGEE